MAAPPVTPDGRYLVVKGRLWRRANPALAEAERARVVRELMAARRAVASARRAHDAHAERAARAAVDAAKRALGERGPVWWTDGAPDLNRRLVSRTPYAAWYDGLGLADPTAALARLYDEDRAEHAAVPPAGTPEYRALRARDRERRERAALLLAALRESGAPSPESLHHAAWILNHGDEPREARLAHELAREAAALGHAPARWLAAAAHDRWCMYEGRPQRYGTQLVPDGERIRLWDVEPGVTDEERARWDVPPLAEQRRRAGELTRTEAQPPMEDAPAWLRAAIARWRADEG